MDSEILDDQQCSPERDPEVVAAIVKVLSEDPLLRVIAKQEAAKGSNSLCELAQKLTDKFEALSTGTDWG
jgi:hypothetical protein